MSIIKDTLTKQREYQEFRKKRLERLIELNAPTKIIEHEKMLSEMTWGEYKLYEKQQKEEHQKQISEYAKNNPLQESIVHKIYERVENVLENPARKLPNNLIRIIDSYLYFLEIFDPLEFMSEEDFNNDLYESFLRHAHDLVRLKIQNHSEIVK